MYLINTLRFLVEAVAVTEPHLSFPGAGFSSFPHLPEQGGQNLAGYICADKNLDRHVKIKSLFKNNIKTTLFLKEQTEVSTCRENTIKDLQRVFVWSQEWWLTPAITSPSHSGGEGGGSTANLRPAWATEWAPVLRKQMVMCKPCHKHRQRTCLFFHNVRLLLNNNKLTRFKGSKDRNSS